MNAVTAFVAAVRSLSFENAFNPYTDRCAVYDKPGAPAKRWETLRGILAAAAARGVHSVWIGRDLGYRGGRRTGLALTDDVHRPMHEGTTGQGADRSSGVEGLDRIDLPIFLWNVFPLHPHEPGRPFTNRSHRASERAAGEHVLSELLALLRPERVIAIGGDAARSAERIVRISTVRVRHPSYGGQADFLRQMSDLYGICGSHSGVAPDSIFPRRAILRHPKAEESRQTRECPPSQFARMICELADVRSRCPCFIGLWPTARKL
jgi:uracil-DNA glycosylase